MAIPELRWLQKEWIHEASKLEWHSSEKFWTIDHFHSLLSNQENRRYVIPLVCIIDDNIAGYNVYRLTKKSYNIINMVVGLDYRRQGIGTLLIQNVISKLEDDKSDKSSIKMRVRDTNEEGIKFLEKVGFKFSGLIENRLATYDKVGGTNLKQNAFEYVYKKS